MMMTDREKLAEIVRGASYRCLPSNTTNFHLGLFVTDLLSNGVTFPKHAHWTINGKWAECSNCREGEKIAVLVHKDYCPACGAIMDEGSVVIHP